MVRRRSTAVAAALVAASLFLAPGTARAQVRYVLGGGGGIVYTTPSAYSGAAGYGNPYFHSGPFGYGSALGGYGSALGGYGSALGGYGSPFLGCGLWGGGYGVGLLGGY